MANRKKTSFTLSAECIQSLKHLASINNRSMANMIETLVSDKVQNREDEFFNYMDKKHKTIDKQAKKVKK